MWKKPRRLGIAEEKRKYDFPLNKDEGTDFLTFLISLMTFLAVMALAASFALGGMAGRWTSGLENRVTIEIPAQIDGRLREQSEINGVQDRIATSLRNNPNVKSFDIMDKNDIQGLIEPWLGKDALSDTIPLPGLISVEVVSSIPENMEKMKSDLATIDNGINLDTHESWLRELLSLTGALQMAALIITTIIGLTTVAAVAGAVRTRMAIHRADVELLHLMGASDEYITKQFQRHTFFLALKGGAFGTVACGVVLGAIALLSGDVAAAMLPEFSLSPLQIVTILCAPLAACIIAGTTARFTVLRALSEMP